MRRYLLLLVCAANVFAAGPLIVGFRGGASFNDSLGGLAGGVVPLTGYGYAIGPTFGFRFTPQLSVEGDALWRRQTLGVGGILGGIAGVNVHSDSWQVPVMLKYATGDGPIAAVFGGGVNFRRLSENGSVPSYLLNGATSTTSAGFIAAGGLRFRTGGVDITPELRYTRWNNTGWTQSLMNTVFGNRNQAEVMVGLTF